MTFFPRRMLPAAALLLLSAALLAADKPADDGELAQVRRAVQAKLPGIDSDNIQPSPVTGIYELSKGSMIMYISADGRFLFDGEVIDMATGEQITESRRQGLRTAVVDALADNMVIEYPPPPPFPTKHMVTVFTDIDCGYCRKMHRDLDGYHQRGIGLRYLFFPRSGPNTPSFAKAQSVWCSKDPTDALTRAKQGENLPPPTCDTTVLDQYKLGRELGVRGTPFVILPNGELVNGYLKPAALAMRLQNQPKQDTVSAR